MFKLYLDPGHGGKDSGAIGNGLMEKNITLTICQRIRDRLQNEYEGIDILMSRTGDCYPTLPARTEKANAWGADYYLSVHINSGGATGFESFIYPGAGQPTSSYQNTIHQEIVKATGFYDRGKKQENFHVLRESRMPALLTENGFIDNTQDAAKLKDPKFIEKIVTGHVQGIVEIAHLKPLSPKNSDH
ncbi:MAG: N-acetylmuramoyl-L-alanine amidase [Bacillales bacterium]|nr:N-acetylmuramoyl-L-alanine amidase [Bacillales bacterium]